MVISLFLFIFACEIKNVSDMLKFIQGIIRRCKMRKEAKEAAYGALCEEQKDSLFSWERDNRRERSRQTRQAWITAALDGDPTKQAWLASCIESGTIKL